MRVAAKEMERLGKALVISPSLHGPRSLWCRCGRESEMEVAQATRDLMLLCFMRMGVRICQEIATDMWQVGLLRSPVTGERLCCHG